MSRACFIASELSMEGTDEWLDDSVAASEAKDGDVEVEERNDDSADGSRYRKGGSRIGACSSSSSYGTFGLNGTTKFLDLWMKRYVTWLDSYPLLARCVTCAVTECIGSILTARRAITTSNNVHRRGHNNTPTKIGIDWLEVLAFALHGALVAGPLSYRVDSFMENNFYDSQSSLVLFDQVVVTPVQLFVMFTFVDSIKVALRALPSSMHKSWQVLAGNVSESMLVWPLSIYILLKILKKRRHYLAAINLCSIAWASHLAKKRRTLRQQQQQQQQQNQ